MDPFGRKYGKALTAALAIVPVIAEIIWVPGLLISLGTNMQTHSNAQFHRLTYSSSFLFMSVLCVCMCWLQGRPWLSSWICPSMFASGSLLQWPSPTPFLEVSIQSLTLTSSSYHWCFLAWWVSHSETQRFLTAMNALVCFGNLLKWEHTPLFTVAVCPFCSDEWHLYKHP